MLTTTSFEVSSETRASCRTADGLSAYDNICAPIVISWQENRCSLEKICRFFVECPYSIVRNPASHHVAPEEEVGRVGTFESSDFNSHQDRVGERASETMVHVRWHHRRRVGTFRRPTITEETNYTGSLFGSADPRYPRMETRVLQSNVYTRATAVGCGIYDTSLARHHSPTHCRQAYLNPVMAM